MDEKLERALVEGNIDYTAEDILRRLDENGYKVELKDAPNPEEYMRGFEDGRRAAWNEKGQAFFSSPASIRIEALRAAAAVCRGAMDVEGADTQNVSAMVLQLSAKFAAYLESGE